MNTIIVIAHEKRAKPAADEGAGRIEASGVSDEEPPSAAGRVTAPPKLAALAARFRE